jgi:GAF domain-containing protein
MHESDSIVDSNLPKPALYAEIAGQVRALTEGEHDLIANLANTASLLYHSMPDLNWVGFYLLKDDELVVSPFQGKPACVRIAMGKGVCGTAAAQRAPVIVENVHEFAGHIACDSASNSEIVLPIVRGNELIGVLDLDSPKFARFDEQDQAGLEQVVAALVKTL